MKYPPTKKNLLSSICNFFQLCVADSLIPLAALFVWPAIAGITFGCLFGEGYFWMGPQDVILGTITN
jgi:hypothetical protein